MIAKYSNLSRPIKIVSAIVICITLFYFIGSDSTKLKSKNAAKSVRFELPQGNNENNSRFLADRSMLSEWEIMILSIAFYESRCFDDVKNKVSSATGVLQLLNEYVDDCNRIAGYNKYSYSDRLNIDKTLEMFNMIQMHYNPEKNIYKAIKLHSVGFAEADANYIDKVMRGMDIIKRYEIIRNKLQHNQE